MGTQPVGMRMSRNLWSVNRAISQDETLTQGERDIAAEMVEDARAAYLRYRYKWQAERTAAALAAAEAEVARLRAALDEINGIAANGGQWSVEQAAKQRFYIIATARAALNPEATHENG